MKLGKGDMIKQMMHQQREGGKALVRRCDTASIMPQSVVPHTGFEWHSLLSKAPEFPPVQLALYPSPPLLDPSCTLSTGRKKNRETAEKGTQAGQAKAYIQTDRQTVQWTSSATCPLSSKSPTTDLKLGLSHHLIIKLF